MDVEVLKFIYTYLFKIHLYIYEIKLCGDLSNLNVGGDLFKI